MKINIFERVKVVVPCSFIGARLKTSMHRNERANETNKQIGFRRTVSAADEKQGLAAGSLGVGKNALCVARLVLEPICSVVIGSHV